LVLSCAFTPPVGLACVEPFTFGASMMQVQMQVQTRQPDTQSMVYLAHDGDHFGGDQSPLNDADSDEDRDPEGELDLSELDLEVIESGIGEGVGARLSDISNREPLRGLAADANLVGASLLAKRPVHPLDIQW
jgi:hypothetical protein